MNFLASKKIVTTLIVFLVLLNVTLLGFLWRQNSCTRQPTGTRQFHRQNPFTRPLGLSESQTESFQQLRQKHFRNVQPDIEAVGVLKKQMVEEALKVQPDQNKISTLADSIGMHQASLERALALHFHELAKICKPEQRDSLRKVLDRISTRRLSEKRERGGFHHPTGQGQFHPEGTEGPR